MTSQAESGREPARAALSPTDAAEAETTLTDAWATRLPVQTILTFSLPTFGVGYMYLLINLYMMKFATDVLLISPIAMGTIFLAARFSDAVSDPLAGYLSDRTKTRLGRRRPWLIASVLPLFAVYLMVWSPPGALAGGWLVVWMAVGVIGFYAVMTVFIVPHTSLGAELTSSHHDRTRVFSWRHVTWTVGSVASLAGMQLLVQAESPRQMAFWVAAIPGALTGALILYSALRLRERPEYQGKGGDNPYRAFADVVRNPHARLLLIVFFIENIGGATIPILTPYIAHYIVGTPEYMAFYILCYMIASIVSVPIWLPLSRRFGKKNLWLFSMITTALAFGGMFFLEEGSAVLISVLAVVAGLGGGCGAIVGPSVQADVIDYDEYATGQRKEGAYFAAWGLAFKAATGICIFLTGHVLAFSGFTPGAEQSEETKLALLSLYALFPLVCYGIGAALFLRFKLNEGEHAQIRRELEERARAR